MTDQANSDLGNNLYDALEGAGAKNAKKPAKGNKGIKANEGEGRTWIVVEDNPDIPPTGLPISVNGEVCILMPGEPVHILDRYRQVLDHAIISMPVMDATQRVVGHRERHRFPYRTVAAPADDA